MPGRVSGTESRHPPGETALTKRSQQFKLEDLARMLVYVLGYRPDEFGLAPDGEGFVSLKELLQALHEEPSWRFVRQPHVNEVLLSGHRSRFEIRDDAVRALEREWRFEPEASWHTLPKLLFAPVRRRAHPVVLEKGLIPPEGGRLILSPDRTMAGRIGMRRDPEPVLLEIRAVEAARNRVRFFPFGRLFLAPEVPAEFIAGPPVPKEIVERQAAARAAAHPPPTSESPFPAGTFLLDGSKDPDRQRRAKGKKSRGWKEDAKKMRKRRS